MSEASSDYSDDDQVTFSDCDEEIQNTKGKNEYKTENKLRSPRNSEDSDSDDDIDSYALNAKINPNSQSADNTLITQIVKSSQSIRQNLENDGLDKENELHTSTDVQHSEHGPPTESWSTSICAGTADSRDETTSRRRSSFASKIEYPNRRVENELVNDEFMQLQQTILSYKAENMSCSAMSAFVDDFLLNDVCIKKLSWLLGTMEMSFSTFIGMHEQYKYSINSARLLFNATPNKSLYIDTFNEYFAAFINPIRFLFTTQGWGWNEEDTERFFECVLKQNRMMRFDIYDSINNRMLLERFCHYYCRVDSHDDDEKICTKEHLQSKILALPELLIEAELTRRRTN